MPRVVPSQVVMYIGATFSWAAGEGRAPRRPVFLVRQELRALVRLIDNIPEELLRLDPAGYAELLTAVAALELAVPENGRDMSAIEINAIRSLHRLLQICPDDFPSPTATDPAFIPDPELREDLHRDIGEVERALHNGEWKAATVLAGSVLEALFLWACQNRAEPDAVAAAEKKLNKRIERWDLAELVSVAHELGLITTSTRDAANQAREYRNLIHPGRAQRLSARCNRATALLSAGAIEAVVVDLS